MKKTLLIGAALACCALAQAGHHESAGATADVTPASTDEDAMMAAMIAAATPGEPHRFLAEHTGNFIATTTSWPYPGAEPQVMTMTVERRMDLGGRVLEERWTGDFGGAPFSGYSRTGYDNHKKHYWTTWTDNMSTGLFVAYGKEDERTGQFVFEGEATDPATGKPIPTRSVVTYADDGGETMDMYQVQAGEEYKAMSFTLVPR